MVRNSMMDARLVLATALAAAVMFVPHAAGQCEPATEQLVPFNVGAQGVSGNNAAREVSASIEWDPDGAGPEGKWLVVGGDFSTINGTVAHKVAAWDGEAWRSFGLPYVAPGGRITSLGIHDGHLIAAGEIKSLGGVTTGCLFELTSEGWRLFEGKPGPGVGPGSVAITCMLSIGSDLYVAGYRLTADGASSQTSIVRWDGSGYHDVGYPYSTDAIYAMVIHRGELFVAGDLKGTSANPQRFVARYDGVDWHRVGDGVDQIAYSLFSDGDSLYAGTRAAAETSSCALKWDGTSWTSVGGNLGLHSSVVGWIENDGELLACVNSAHGELGVFSEMSTWRLDGPVWQPITPHPSPNDFPTASSRSFGRFEGDLVVTGAKYQPTKSRRTGGVARLRDGMWSTVDGLLDGHVLSILQDGEDVITTGTFTSAGGYFTPGAFALTDAGIQPLNAPLFFEGRSHDRVRCAVRWGDRLCILGNFLTDDPASTGVLVRDDAGTWAAMPHPYASFDGADGAAVGGTLYVATNTSGSGVQQGLAAVDESGEWRTIVPDAAGTDVWATLEYEGQLIVGGAFTALNGVSVHGVASFDGESWQPVGSGLNGSVTDLVAHNGSLWAAGFFTVPSTGTSAALARWDGEAWHAVPTPTSGTMRVKSVDGRLFISSSDGGAYVRNAGRWVNVRSNGHDHGIYGAAELGGRPVVLGVFASSPTNWRVPLALSLPCATDYVCDGTSDILDLLDFIQAHADCSDGLLACDPIRADFNQDGLVDVLDVLDFVDAMAGGC